MSKLKLKDRIPLIYGWFGKSTPESIVSDIIKIPKSILIIKQSERLGNIVLALASISALKKTFPETRIDMMLPAAFSDIMSSEKNINKIIPVYKREYISKPWKLFSLIKLIRANRYDMAIDFSDVINNSSTGAMYTMLTGAKVVAGWERPNTGRFDVRVPIYANVIHASEMYLKLISGIFDREMSGDPFFEEYESERKPDKVLVGINCGGRGSKRLPIDNFLKIAEKLSEKNIKSELILGPAEDNLRSGLGKKLPQNCGLLPLTPMSKLKNRFKRYSIFVTSDTGPMHLAWALKIPVVSIFLDSVVEKYRPLSKGSVVFEAKNGFNINSIYDSIIEILESKEIPS